MTKALRFRSKETLIHDLNFILNCSEVHSGTKFAVLAETLFMWTENYNEKFVGCPFWSKEAIEHYIRERDSGKNQMESLKGLRHDHIVPRVYFRKILLESEVCITEQLLWELFNNFLYGAIVTKAEDHKLSTKDMPPPFYDRTHPNFQDKWLRYRDNIKMCKVDWTEKKKRKNPPYSSLLI